MFSSKSRQIVRQATKMGLDPGTSYTFLFAKGKGFPIHYFPSEYEEILEIIPKNQIFDEKLDPNWVNRWMKLWPTMGQVLKEGYQLDYAISGHAPEVRKRMKKFVGPGPEGFCERMGISEDDCDLEYKLDIIWKATEAYIEHLRNTEYQFPKKNHKFIIDNGGSILEEWCHRVINKVTDEPKRTFRI